MDPLELRIVAPSALELPAPVPWPSPPKDPWPSTPKIPPGLTFTTLPNERNKEPPCNSPQSRRPPPDPRSTRERTHERACRADGSGSGASRTQKGGGAIKAINGRIPRGRRGRGGGSAEVQRRWRRGKRERRGQPGGVRRQEKNSGRVWLCDDRSSPCVKPGQHPSI
jgi:hypothetical protein